MTRITKKICTSRLNYLIKLLAIVQKLGQKVLTVAIMQTLIHLFLIAHTVAIVFLKCAILAAVSVTLVHAARRVKLTIGSEHLWKA